MFFCCSSLSLANDNQQKKSPPLVLSIPGFLVPGKKMTQEQHFGNLNELMNDLDIPYHCMVYDSKNDPLSAKSGLITQKYSIVSTRVIPDILLAIEKEQIRRDSNDLPPLKEVVLIGYSQGGLITLQFIGRNHMYKKKYAEYHKEFGDEYESLINDPVYKDLVQAVNIYEKILAVKYQNERQFKKNRDLMQIYDWLELDVRKYFRKLKKYINDPKSVFPNSTTFDPHDTARYPKEYIHLKDFFAKNERNQEFMNQFYEFISEDAFFRSLRDIEFRSICLSGSLFGSPRANIGYEMLEQAPIFKKMIKGVEQIKDTRLGSPQHLKSVEALIHFENDADYLLNEKNSLFIIGANRQRGDDFVEQPCGHLSGHQLAEIDLAVYRCKYEDRNKPAYIKKLSIPDLPVVPLEVHHFPVKTFFGLGPVLPGSAYIDNAEHPSFKYIKAFIEKDFDALDEYRNNNKTVMRQFMVEFTLGKIERIKERLHELHLKNDTKEFNKLIKTLNIDVKLINRPADIHIQAKYLNKENLTYIFIGAFEEDLIVLFKEDLDIEKEYPLDFVIKVKGYPPLNITLPVKAGEITFVRVYDTTPKVNNVK